MSKSSNISISIMIVSIVIFTFLLVSHIYSFYLEEKKLITEETLVLFKDAVNIDYNERVVVLTDRLYMGNNHRNSDTVVFTSKSGTIKKPRRYGRTEEEKMKEFCQYILNDKNPINVFVVDSIFQARLKSGKIPMKTAISLTDEIHKRYLYSVQDTLLYTPLLSTPDTLCSAGLYIQAYIQIPSILIFSRLPFWYWLALTGWLILVFILGFVIYRIKKRIPLIVLEREQKVTEEMELKLQALADKEETLRLKIKANDAKRHQKLKKEEEEKRLVLIENEKELRRELEQKDLAIKAIVEKEQNEANELQILTEDLIYNRARKSLLYKKEIVSMTNKQAHLLDCLLASPEYFCTVEELADNVWTGLIVQNNTIHQCLSRLNAALKNIPGIYIENKTRVGYRLRIERLENKTKEESSKEEADTSQDKQILLLEIPSKSGSQLLHKT